MLYNSSLNFSNPLNARRWLNLLEVDRASGLRIKPDCNLARDILGFTFDSNKYGLRGPSKASAPNVIMGTSYAMGFGVDIGLDWYHGLLEDYRWFNVGLPVGPVEWQNLLLKYHSGRRGFLLFIYHPNIWQHGIDYLKMRDSGVSAFEYFGWKTGLLDCLVLSCNKSLIMRRHAQEGRVVFADIDGRVYMFNSYYARFSYSEDSKWIRHFLKLLQHIFESFERVLCVRVVVKEQLVPFGSYNRFFSNLVDEYHKSWELFKSSQLGHRCIKFVETSGFTLSDFHPRDTHLNSHGNERLRRSISDVLR